ncbi:GNAT family N-acetyltransferase [Paenibacillus sp. Root52]|uniref:GNAT family N-acetyltransferase n=1 Tax=Paenibacillus sp. Root52 TaxID=1736552 RepID=UPI000AE09E82
MITIVTFPMIETDRLVLRELTMLDVQAVFQHFSDATVTQFMDIEPCVSLTEAEEIIQFHIADSGCRYGLFLKLNHEFVGTCGFHCWDQGQPSKAEIGFDLSASYWGQGLMHEALTEVVKIGFDHMKVDYIEATVEQENARSIRLLQKMHFYKHDELVDKLLYYTLTKREAAGT